MKPTQEKGEAELRGAGKLLDSLWDNSYYLLGKLGADRIEKEMIYYFGKNWNEVMYKFIGKDKEIKTLKALVTNHSQEK